MEVVREEDATTWPLWRLLDARVAQVDDAWQCELPTSEWHCRFDASMSPAILAAATNGLGSMFAWLQMEGGTTFAGLEQSIYLFRPVAADGRSLRIRMRPLPSPGDFLAGSSEIVDADGVVVATSQSLGVAIPEELRVTRRRPESKRVLATLLFSDIVGSTDHLARLGDAAWTDLRDRHHGAVRAAIGHWDGVEVDTAGDGFLVRFESPARALDCAGEIRDVVGRLGLTLRMGVHTGECELQGRSLSGVAVHAAARIQAAAEPGEILASDVVKSLVLGSSHRFTDRGDHALKGIPGTWRLFALGE